LPEYAPLLNDLPPAERDFLSPGSLGRSYAAGVKSYRLTELSDMPSVVTIFAYDENPGSDYSGAPYECFLFFNEAEVANSDSPRQDTIESAYNFLSSVLVDAWAYAPAATPESVFHVKGTLP
jgi:hypothetical protein